MLTLNPNDNQGLRDPLIHHYLRVNRIDDALRLAARFPDDLPAMQYGGILALYMADKIEEAARQLKQTARDYPEIDRMLLSADLHFGNVVAVAQTRAISMGLVYYVLPSARFAPEIAHAAGVVFPVFTSYLGHKHWSFR